MTNFTPSILSKLDRNLLQLPGHPLQRVKNKIYQYFKNFHQEDILDPFVTVKQNFDELGFPSDHAGRSQHDSYYINREWMLRTHMTAHEKELIQKGYRKFLTAGTVFRRDEIDSTHYPVFHQLEGVQILDAGCSMGPALATDTIRSLLPEQQQGHTEVEVLYGLTHLHDSLNGLLKHLFGPRVPIRWQPCYFPFTQPSLEVEVEYRGRWVEVLGSGLLQRDFLELSEASSPLAWAFGMGLERLAMILYDIPDIRLFWSTDERFMSQFDPGVSDEGLVFMPFSKYPHIARDLSFWISPLSDYSPNSFYDVVRSIAGDLVENVKLVDEFSKEGQTSHCYRIAYRSMNRSLNDGEVNDLQEAIRNAVAKDLRVNLR